MSDPDPVIAGRYRLDARVGSGAMGVVYRAEDERLRRTVALKQVALGATASDEARAAAHRRVIREGRMIARLHHPNAIAVFDVVDHDDQPWLVMEYLPSRSLAEVLAEDGPLAPRRVAELGRQVAAGLAAAHEAGIVHRDVKPGNVLLAEGGLTKVTDFGIARAVDDATLSSDGMVAGTPAYLAPEVARGGSPDFRSDVSSLGSTLYAALEGVPPYGTADNALAALHRVASGEFDPPRRAGALTPLLLRLLAPEPDRRPGMPRVRDELARLAEAEADTGSEPLTPMLPLPGPLSSASSRSAPSATSAPSAPSAPSPSAPSAPSPSAPGSAPAPPAPGPSGSGSAPAPPAPAPARSSTPGPAAFPAPTVPAATTPVPEQAPDVPQRRPRRRRLALAGAGVAVAAAAVVLVGVLLGTGATTGGTSWVPGLPDSTASPGSSAGGDAGSTGDSSSGEALGGTTDQRARQQAVVDYYGFLPDRLDEGWQRLTPRYQQTTADGFAGYRGFWTPIARVTVRGVSPGAGDAVDATVTYSYRDGRAVDERTVFTMVQADGLWKIDASSVLSSR